MEKLNIGYQSTLNSLQRLSEDIDILQNKLRLSSHYITMKNIFDRIDTSKF